MQAFLTGAAGFVGGHLIPRLEGAGYRVVATDRELDVADAGAVEAALGRVRPELIVHLAAVSSVSSSQRDPGLTYRVNYLGALSVLEGARRQVPGARVLLVGSGDVYGSAAPGDAPFDEEAPLRPRSPYARTKAAADLLGAAYAERGLGVVRVRAFNHAGPGQAEAFVLPSFARQAAEIALGRREPKLRVGNLDSVRDFLDVEDVVAAYLALCDPGVAPGVYNVASGNGVRIGDALDAILRHLDVAPSIEVDPARLRPTDHAVGDATRLRQATGWKPRVPFAETLERVARHARAALNGS